MNKCLWCGKHVKNKVCNASCQMHYEYKVGIRDKYKITEKARKIANKRIKIDNWLNYKSSRDNLRKTMKTEKYKKLQSDIHKGGKNGMWNQTPWNKMSPTKKWYEEKQFMLLRKKCLIRDNFKCVKCGVHQSKKDLYCDHIMPYRICKEHKLDNLQILCGSCHSKKTVKDIKLMKKEGYI